ncbi:hypothetical protein FACS189487_01350 [Campylobacterota bacterium]|nr:hypothetical protein FACS189487_01350 [Campylobacterota bacterium]
MGMLGMKQLLVVLAFMLVGITTVYSASAQENVGQYYINECKAGLVNSAVKDDAAFIARYCDCISKNMLQSLSSADITVFDRSINNPSENALTREFLDNEDRIFIEVQKSCASSAKSAIQTNAGENKEAERDTVSNDTNSNSTGLTGEQVLLMFVVAYLLISYGSYHFMRWFNKDEPSMQDIWREDAPIKDTLIGKILEAIFYPVGLLLFAIASGFIIGIIMFVVFWILDTIELISFGMFIELISNGIFAAILMLSSVIASPFVWRRYSKIAAEWKRKNAEWERKHPEIAEQRRQEEAQRKQEDEQIATVVQKGLSVIAYNAKGDEISSKLYFTNDDIRLQGYTASTYSVKEGRSIVVYDAKGNQLSSNFI